MEIRVLEYFLAVANEENITNAAKVLHISQPTLSRQMMDLEEELNVKLFNKTNRSTTLTEDGLRLKQRAEEIVELARKTKLEFSSNDEDIYGEINIGAGETIYFEYIAKAASRVMKKYPHIQFHFYSGIATDVIEKINNGLLEFGLLIEPVEINNFNTIYLPYPEQFGVLVNRNSPYASLDAITEKELLIMPMITARKAGYGGINDWLSYIDPKLNVVATCNLPYNATILVKENAGCFISAYKPNYSNFEDIIFKPLKPKINRRWMLAWKKAEAFSKAHNVFLEEFKQLLDEEIDYIK